MQSVENTKASIQVRLAESQKDLEDVRELLREYTELLATFIQPDQLSFEYRYAEIASLPGAAVPPKGGIVLALVGDALAGCTVIGPMTLHSGDDAVELRRMFVRPAFRGLGVGRQLLSRAIDLARTAGHSALYLENDPNTMAAAAHLYRTFGFVEIEPQDNDHSLRDATFFRLRLGCTCPL
jgi:putative acetyltransferase